MKPISTLQTMVLFMSNDADQSGDYFPFILRYLSTSKYVRRRPFERPTCCTASRICCRVRLYCCSSSLKKLSCLGGIVRERLPLSADCFMLSMKKGSGAIGGMLLRSEDNKFTNNCKAMPPKHCSHYTVLYRAWCLSKRGISI